MTREAAYAIILIHAVLGHGVLKRYGMVVERNICMTDNACENQEQMNENTILANGALGYDFFDNFTIVVDHLGHYLGVLHLHDILREGII